MTSLAWQPALPGNDTWALSFAGTPTWTQLSPFGTPPSARILHEAILDGGRGRMVVYGGWSGSWLADTWALNLNGPLEWVKLSPTGSATIEIG